jgi:hypothetical protein
MKETWGPLIAAVTASGCFVLFLVYKFGEQGREFYKTHMLKVTPIDWETASHSNPTYLSFLGSSFMSTSSDSSESTSGSLDTEEEEEKTDEGSNDVRHALHSSEDSGSDHHQFVDGQSSSYSSEDYRSEGEYQTQKDNVEDNWRRTQSLGRLHEPHYNTSQRVTPVPQYVGVTDNQWIAGHKEDEKSNEESTERYAMRNNSLHASHAIGAADDNNKDPHWLEGDEESQGSVSVDMSSDFTVSVGGYSSISDGEESD